MTMFVSLLTIVVVTAAIVAFWALVELVQSLATTRRDAARAALRHEFEDHRIDSDAFAKGLRAIDETA